MGRWRPPPPHSSAYITRRGYAALQKELQEIWIRRRHVVSALSAAAAEGDRSENAEYIYRKKQLAGIDRRIRYLQKRLPQLTIVATPDDGDRIRFGAWVTVREGADDYSRYRLVGADEIDHAPEHISIDAPVARALLGKSVDATVRIGLRSGERVLTVVAVDYDCAAGDGRDRSGGESGRNAD